MRATKPTEETQNNTQTNSSKKDNKLVNEELKQINEKPTISIELEEKNINKKDIVLEKESAWEKEVSEQHEKHEKEQNSEIEDNVDENKYKGHNYDIIESDDSHMENISSNKEIMKDKDNTDRTENYFDKQNNKI